MSKIKDGLAAIASEVLEDVRKEAEALIIDSEREAKETLARAKGEAEKAYAEIVGEAKQRVDVERRKSLSVSELEMKHRVLQEKEEMVEKAFEKALAKLNKYVQTADYKDYLLGLIQQSAEKVESKSLIVYVNTKDKAWLSDGHLKRLATKLKVTLNLDDEAQDHLGGCKVQSSDGKIIYDNTIKTQLEQLKPILRHEVARILFGEGE